MCDLYGLENLGEPFYLTDGTSQASQDMFVSASERYFSDQPALMKLHAGHVTEYQPARHRGWFQDVVDITDEIHFLVRADTQAQIKSLFLATFWNQANGDPDKSTHDAFHEDWTETVTVPDTQELRDSWRCMEMIVHTNLMALSALYHMLIDRDPKVVWSEEVSDLLPRGKYNRPVSYDWEPDFMFFPIDVNEIFKANQDCF